MLPDQRPEFSELISGMLAGYGREADEFTLGAWWYALNRFTLPAIRKTLIKYAAESDAKFAPKPAQIAKLLYGQSAPGGGCDLCRHRNPANRLDHWLRLEVEELRRHLQAEFRDHYDKHPQELGIKLAELAEIRQRQYGKVDEFGAPLNSADTIGVRKPDLDLEAKVQTHIEKHDLRRRPGEGRREFARRCMQAAISPNPGPLGAALNAALENVLRPLSEREPGCDDELLA